MNPDIFRYKGTYAAWSPTTHTRDLLADLVSHGLAAADRASVTYEGGETTTKTRYAIRFDGKGDYHSSGNYVSHVDMDGGFARNGRTLEAAVLFDTADEAAKAVARRNAANQGYATEYSIVPVTVTTTTPKVQIVTTETPAKTVYLLRLESHASRYEQRNVGKFISDSGHGNFSYGGTAETATHFATADAAARALAARQKRYANQSCIAITASIVPHTVKGEAKVERHTIQGGTITRTLG